MPNMDQASKRATKEPRGSTSKRQKTAEDGQDKALGIIYCYHFMFILNYLVFFYLYIIRFLASNQFLGVMFNIIIKSNYYLIIHSSTSYTI